MPGAAIDVVLGVSAIRIRASNRCGGDTWHTISDIIPDDPTNMSLLIAFEWTQEIPQRRCMKDVAPLNMRFMSITLDTSHLEMSL